MPRVPYFSWFVGPILRSADKRARAWAERALRAAEAGEERPPPPKRPSLAPPTTFSGQQAVLLATVCAITAGATYGSSLLSQNVDYVGRAFGASDRALGTALAISRAGVLIALVLITLLSEPLAEARGVPPPLSQSASNLQPAFRADDYELRPPRRLVQDLIEGSHQRQ